VCAIQWHTHNVRVNFLWGDRFLLQKQKAPCFKCQVGEVSRPWHAATVALQAQVQGQSLTSQGSALRDQRVLVQVSPLAGTAATPPRPPLPSGPALTHVLALLKTAGNSSLRWGKVEKYQVFVVELGRVEHHERADEGILQG
jgi:hypothetical protein